MEARLTARRSQRPPSSCPGSSPGGGVRQGGGQGPRRGEGRDPRPEEADLPREDAWAAGPGLPGVAGHPRLAGALLRADARPPEAAGAGIVPCQQTVRSVPHRDDGVMSNLLHNCCILDAFSTFQVPVWSAVSAPQRRPLSPLLSPAQVPQSRPEEERLVILELRQFPITPALSTDPCIQFATFTKLGSNREKSLFCVVQK